MALAVNTMCRRLSDRSQETRLSPEKNRECNGGCRHLSSDPQVSESTDPPSLEIIKAGRILRKLALTLRDRALGVGVRHVNDVNVAGTG